MSFAIAFIALVVSSSAMALKSDRDQPADIEADDTLFDFKTGKRTFTGNVIVIQGTLRIKADKVEANYKDGELQNATAWGKPARFKQRPDGKPDDVEGSGRKIFVNSIKNTLLLTSRANLKQGGTNVNGESILYNMANDTLKVQGGTTLKKTGKDGKATPNRKLKDPFADDPLPNTKPKKTTKKGKGKKGKGEKNDKSKGDEITGSEEAEEVVEQTPPPLPVGRSRLIIQPKPKPKSEPETEDDETDSTEDGKDKKKTTKQDSESE